MINGQPIYVLYGHVLEIKVKEGQRVKKGQVVAEVGVGGATTGPDLHLELRVGKNDFFLDPQSVVMVAFAGKNGWDRGKVDLL